MRKYILDENGEPLALGDTYEDSARWDAWWSVLENRVLTRTRIAERVHVSTVFLGRDLNWTGEGEPMLWESMILGGSLHGRSERYTSRADAERGHALLVAMAAAADGDTVH